MDTTSIQETTATHPSDALRRLTRSFAHADPRLRAHVDPSSTRAPTRVRPSSTRARHPPVPVIRTPVTRVQRFTILAPPCGKVAPPPQAARPSHARAVRRAVPGG
ncbi:hypothetical protein GCM10023221_00010 [Luteimicrobium xylanilyticum]